MRTSLLIVGLPALLAAACVAPEVTAPPTALAQPVHARVHGLVHGDLVLRLGDGAGVLVEEDGTVDLGSLPAGESYRLEVMHQPVLPAQMCMVHEPTGFVGGEPLWIDVDCTTLQYPIGGYVVGLAGRGLSLAINGNERIDVGQDGGFVFPHALASGSQFTVEIASQPTSPAQSCRIEGGTGMVTTAGVSTILVDCSVVRFAVGGTVYNLAGRLVVYTSEGDTVELTAAGSFAFPSTVASGSAYSIAIVEQPVMPAQTCTITSGGSGVVDATDVSSIVIDCKTKRFGVAGQVTGLAGSGLVLQLNGYEVATPDDSGGFQFYARVPSGQPYSVAVVGQPASPPQNCAITGGGVGTVGVADIALSVTCSTGTLIAEN